MRNLVLSRLAIIGPVALLIVSDVVFSLDADLGNVLPSREVIATKDGAPHGVPDPRPHAAGDDIATAIPIPAIPFTDTGNTCTFLDDYDEACPFTASTSPDVVWAYESPGNLWVDIRLCDSGYDTKVYVYENAWPNLVACNDDACGPDGFRSELMILPLTAGNTYYVVVDGYGGDCGDYVLEIYDIEVEIVVCPSDALLEGEEDCHDGYEDRSNSGCNAPSEPVFSPLHGTPDGAPFAVCGTSGTFLVDGNQYRDTDWYEFHVLETSTISFHCVAEFPLRIFLLDGNSGCADPEILATATGGSVPDYALLTYDFEPGTYWYWVGPDGFTGVPCGRPYVSTVTGLTAGVVSTRTASWGSVKELYR